MKPRFGRRKQAAEGVKGQSLPRTIHDADSHHELSFL
jgi:hypothetical protein